MSNVPIWPLSKTKRSTRREGRDKGKGGRGKLGERVESERFLRVIFTSLCIEIRFVAMLQHETIVTNADWRLYNVCICD